MSANPATTTLKCSEPGISADLALRLCPHLETDRLALEPLGECHADAFFEQLQDDALYQWIGMEKPVSRQWLRDHWRAIEVRLAPNHQTAWPTWALRRTSDGVYLGRVDAEITLNMQASNVGYYLFRPHWGQGYSTEAVLAVTRHLIGQGVHRLVATVTAGNSASERVLQKAGYAFTQVLVGNDVIRGAAMDDLEYVLLVR
jgi:RimJ/RimL family protein N-acetyltransferase